MRRVWLMFALGVMAATPGQAAEAPDKMDQGFSKLCAGVTCRQPGHVVVLRDAKGQRRAGPQPALPYLDAAGDLRLFPGDTVTLALPSNGKGPARLHKVEDSEGARVFDPTGPMDALVTFHFVQMDGRPDMVLTISNATSAALKYDAGMIVMTPDGGSRFELTTSCPLRPLLGGQTVPPPMLEHWPHPIWGLVLHNLRVLERGADMACR